MVLHPESVYVVPDPVLILAVSVAEEKVHYTACEHQLPEPSCAEPDHTRYKVTEHDGDTGCAECVIMLGKRFCKPCFVHIHSRLYSRNEMHCGGCGDDDHDNEHETKHNLLHRIGRGIGTVVSLDDIDEKFR